MLPQPLSPSLRTVRRLAVAALLASMALGAPAWVAHADVQAQTRDSGAAEPSRAEGDELLIPVETEAPESATASTPEARPARSALWIALVALASALTIALLLGLLMTARRMSVRQSASATMHQRAQDARSTQRIPTQPMRYEAPHPHASAGASRPSLFHGAGHGDVGSGEPQTLVAAAPSERIASPLLMHHGLGAPMSLPCSDHIDTGVSSMACPQCDRRYDVGVAFCLFDGYELEPLDDDDHVVDAVETDMICPTCDTVHEPGSIFCPHDGARLKAADVLRDTYAPVPITICPKCHREYLPGVATCPDDGAELRFLVGRRTAGLSLSSPGPLTRICPECGTRYGSHAAYCGHEGAELVNVN